MPGMDGPPPPPEEMGGGFGPGDPGEGPPRIDQGPRRQPAHLVLVAVVPIDNVREFIDRLNTEQDHADSALLVNDNGDILVSKNPSTAGLNLLAQLSPELRERMNTLLTGTKTDPLVINQPYTIGSAEMPPQIMVASRLTVPSGRHWTVLISSPLSSVETLVNTIFRSALVWATVVTVSITGILLSTSFFMIRSRVRFERMRHEVLTRELQQARHIQLAWLPDTKSPPPGLEVSAANLPASHISGDFYNWFRLPQRAGAGGGAGGGEQEEAADSSRIAVVIGDVTGHGMAAAFLMATTQLLIRMTLTRYQDPGRALREVNKQLCTQSFKGQFVTMLVVVLDPAANTVEIATAGHPLPLVRTERDGGLFKELSLEPQLVLGVDPDETYTTQGFVLEPGASVLLYTDGVVEAEANSGEQYGVNRLRDLLNRNLTGTGDASAPERIRLILEDVKRFCGTRELMDDVTLVALRTTPSAVVAAAAHAARL
jgi:serine phosphatase RsbU (regulator of sigma subunit)